MPTVPEVLCVDFAVFTCIQGAVMSLLLAFKGLQAHNLDIKADACLWLILIPTVQSGIEGNRAVDTKPRMPDDVIERTKTWKLTEIIDSSQCRSIRLPDTLPLNKVSRLIYTNAGVALLALATNAVHKLWKWQRSDRNPTGKVGLVSKSSNLLNFGSASFILQWNCCQVKDLGEKGCESDVENGV
jgi:hypothetical protein